MKHVLSFSRQNKCQISDAKGKSGQGLEQKKLMKAAQRQGKSSDQVFIGENLVFVIL